MKYTRRAFLETAGTIVAAAGSGCARPRVATAGLSGAPGVELGATTAAMPDYSRDLERYLVRLAGDARASRQQAIGAISTPHAIAARQKAITDQLWKMLGGPLERTPLNPRVTGIVERSGYRIEKLA